MGFKPICAKTSAANIPQGPKPTTTGRTASSFAQSAGTCTGGCHCISGVAWICGCCACCCSNCCSSLLLWSCTSTIYTTCSFCRASKLRLNTFQFAMASIETPSESAINSASEGGYRGGLEAVSGGSKAPSSGSLSSDRRIIGAWRLSRATYLSPSTCLHGLKYGRHSCIKIYPPWQWCICLRVNHRARAAGHTPAKRGCHASAW